MNNLPQCEISEALYRKASRGLLPLSGTFELSPVCNFDCKMCYVRRSAAEVAAHDRPIRTLEDWRRTARQAREAGMLFLLLTGGEPFLWPGFGELYEELVEMGIIVTINTNGSLIDGAAIARLKTHPPRRINITLYGAGDETYGRLCGVRGMFDRVDRAIRGLREAGICVKLNCSLTPYNEHDLEAMIAYAQALDLQIDVTSYMFPPIRRDEDSVGVNRGRFSPEKSARYRLRAYELQNPPEYYRRLLGDIRAGYMDPPGLDEGCYDPLDGRIRCRAGKASFWITWDGWLTPCGLMPQPRVDLTGRDFPGAWQELTEKSAAVRLSGVCAQCSNQRICHPCAAMALAETGTSEGIPQYLCRTVQEMRCIAQHEMETLAARQIFK